MRIYFLNSLPARCLLMLGSLGLLLSNPITLWATPNVPDQTAVRYGVSIPIGPAQEPCEDEQSTPGAIILSNQDDWEETIDEAAPGST